MKKLTFTLLMAVCWQCSIYCQIIYVKSTANGDGYSWESPVSNLQQALRMAKPGNQIWVAAGTYFPSECKDCTIKDRRVAFLIPKGIKVYGGFLGVEQTLEERNWKVNPSKLSGNIGREDNLDNSFTVVHFENADPETVIDGFYIIEGHASENGTPGNPDHSGAGIFNICTIPGGQSNPGIQNCLFMDNIAWEGGAIFNFSKSGNAGAFITDCRFVNNKAGFAAGAILDQVTSIGLGHSTIANCRFVNNKAIYGGSYFTNRMHPQHHVFFSCHFINNNASFGGAALLLTGTLSTDQLGQDCHFKNNKASEGNNFFFQKGHRLPDNLMSSTALEDL